MIPKIIHQIWLGAEDMPPEFQTWALSWREKHPDWSYKLWTDSNLPSLVNREIFDSQGKLPAPLCYGFQSDLVRLEVLARHGGVYVDVDNECIRPLDDLIVEQSFIVAMEAVHEDRIPNDFIASRPNHPVVWEMIRLAPQRMTRVMAMFKQGLQPTGMDTAGPKALMQTVSSGRYQDITVLPHQLIHPYRRWLDEGYQDYDGAAYVRNHLRPELGMWKRPVSIASLASV
jgi:mannosyltransferase OCH1-like enzyme